MKIGELAKRSSLTAHTLRYYERIGLLPYADRNGSGLRDYDDSILVWLDFIRRLKTTGMPIRTMLRYAALREAGDSTAVERMRLLQEHRDRVRAHVAELNAALPVLDAKIAGYANASTRISADDLPQLPIRKPLRSRSPRSR